MDRWQQIERLCHSALEREESQRGEFVKEVCAGDEELRREVESLLAHDQAAGTFLQEPAIKVAAGALREEQGASLVGSQLGSYHIFFLCSAPAAWEKYIAPRI